MDTKIISKFGFRTFSSTLLVFLSVSCDSFVDVELPKSQLTGSSAFLESNTANAAMVNIYAGMRDQGILSGTSLGISHNLGVYTDELTFYGASSYAAFYFFNNALLPSNIYVTNYWNAAYSQIYAANAVSEGVNASAALSTQDVQRLKGEALFVRALLHFYLVNLYGDIPYVTTTDYQINSSVPRLPSGEIYGHIISDLQQAIALLPEEYYGMGRVRPNRYAAAALLARAYLYNSQWAEAAEVASSVINYTALYSDEMNLQHTFLKDSPETIWQLSPAVEGRNTDEAATFTLFAAPPATVALTDELVNAFSPEDARKAAWIGQVTDGNSIWYYPAKYRQAATEAASSEYSIVFRLPEQYLIRAEARALQGDNTGSVEDLDHIRHKAGLAGSTANNLSDILQEILTQRRLEFFSEYGHRFFDLKRAGQLETSLQGIKPGWDPTDSLFPLPETELLANPNLLPQNPGY